MKKALFLLCLLVMSAVCQAQSSYCLSFADYLEGQWQPLDHLQLKHRTETKVLMWGGSNIKPVTGHKSIDKLLKKKARLIRHNDSLYVNCRHLSCDGVALGNWYAPAYVFERDYLLLIAPSIETRRSVNNMSFLFGIVGGLVAASTGKPLSCYVLNPATTQIELIGRDMMARLTNGQTDLQMEYKQTDPGLDFRPDTVLPFLQKLGLVDKLPATM